MKNFISINDLKNQLGCSSINIIKHPTTGTLFARTENDQTLKVAMNFDGSLPVKFLYDDCEGLTTGCIINVKESNNNVIATL